MFCNDRNLGLGFIVSVSFVQALNNLTARFVSQSSTSKKRAAPIVPALVVAYAVRTKLAKRYLGDTASEILAIASMFIGIDSQFGVFSKLADFMKMHSSKKTKTRRTVIRKATGSDSS